MGTFHSLFNIAYGLRKDFAVELKQNSIVYKNGTGKEIVIYKDWLAGLQERYEFEMPFPYGSYLMINENFLEGALKKYGFRLGYVLKTTFRTKTRGYGKVEKIENFEFLNVSKLIYCSPLILKIS